MSRAHLDWSDEAAVRQWLSQMRGAVSDAHGVTADLLLPLRERELGHVKHRELYEEARRSLLSLLEYATPPGKEP